MTEALVAFGLVAALMTITPGLDTLLVLRASATGVRASARTKRSTSTTSIPTDTITHAA